MRKASSVLRVRHPRYKWKVSYKETQPDGSPIRRFAYFVIKKEAEAFAEARAAELTNHGTRHGTVEDDERAALIKFRVWAAKRADAPSLSAMIEHAIAAHETARPPLTVSEAINARLDAADRRGLSARHQADLKCRLERFCKAFGARQVSDVRLADVEAWLHRLDVSAGTWANYARVVGSVFTLAAKRGYIQGSPLVGLDRPKVVRKAPCILTSAQFRNLLTAATPELRPLLVLQGFCGLRRAEAMRLRWQHVHLKNGKPFVELPSEVTKTNRRRSHEIPSCAVKWLRPLAGLPGASLGLTDAVYDDRLRDAAEAAKISWEENLLRHSFGTYRLCVTKNAASVAEEMGNSANVVRTHYANIASPEEAAAWWRIMPAPSAKTIAFRKARAAS